MIDPTFNLYLIDRDNNPLSILEIRNISADRKDVFLSKEVNYNGKEVDINIVPNGFDVPKRKAANIEYRVREFDNFSLKDKLMKIEAATKRVYRDMSVLY